MGYTWSSLPLFVQENLGQIKRERTCQRKSQRDKDNTAPTARGGGERRSDPFSFHTLRLIHHRRRVQRRIFCRGEDRFHMQNSNCCPHGGCVASWIHWSSVLENGLSVPLWSAASLLMGYEIAEGSSKVPLPPLSLRQICSLFLPSSPPRRFFAARCHQYIS